jgi:hypothetical protein
MPDRDDQLPALPMAGFYYDELDFPAEVSEKRKVGRSITIAITWRLVQGYPGNSKDYL